MLGFQPASNTEQIVAEIGPLAWFPACGVSCQNVSLFPPDRVDIETSPQCDPLADLFNSGGSLWHSLFAEQPCDCGDSTRLDFSHHRTHFEGFCTSRSPVRWTLLVRCGRRLEQCMPVIVSFCRL